MTAAWFRRLGHYTLLVVLTAALTLPNLGQHSLWDIDEGVNAEAAREMLEAGNWIVPTFNFELRSAKPVLLYWLQMLSYLSFGVNEWSARLPSVLCAMLSVLLTYEIGRRFLAPTTALLAAAILASSLEFCVLAHAATPDSVLLACTLLSFLAFWTGYAPRPGESTPRRAWFIPFGAACGLATLAKGPIGLALPGLVLLLFLIWEGQWTQLLDRRLLWGALAFLIVAAPWYTLVTLETRGRWLVEFVRDHNLRRFHQPLENHSGGWWYHLIALGGFYAPWSAFLLPVAWDALRGVRRPAPDRSACRWLVCWFWAYLVFFSLAGTKLPNYVLPLYPALALLTARTLMRWVENREPLPRWVWGSSAIALSMVGVVMASGVWIASGRVDLTAAGLPPYRGPHLSGLENWWPLGLLPVAAALWAVVCTWRRHHGLALSGVVAGSTAFIGLMASFAVLALDPHKAPRPLVAEAGVRQPHRDIRIASFDYYRPTLVFYCERQVQRLTTAQEVVEFLQLPIPAYLFVPADIWEHLQRKGYAPSDARPIARHYDFLRNGDIVVIATQGEHRSLTARE